MLFWWRQTSWCIGKNGFTMQKSSDIVFAASEEVTVKNNSVNCCSLPLAKRLCTVLALPKSRHFICRETQMPSVKSNSVNCFWQNISSLAANMPPRCRKKAETVRGAFYLAGVVGIEPTSKVLETPILPLNHTPIGKKLDTNKIGAPSGTRTPDRPVMSRLL